MPYIFVYRCWDFAPEIRTLKHALTAQDAIFWLSIRGG